MLKVKKKEPSDQVCTQFIKITSIAHSLRNSLYGDQVKVWCNGVSQG